MNVDLANGAFELVGAAVCWINAHKLFVDREVKGVYWPATAFFTVWGVWNLFYYPALGQWYSFAAGVFLVTGNAAWVVLALKFRRRTA